LVEAPGTAPGSVMLISQYVYRHSWKPTYNNINQFSGLLQ